MHRKADIPFHNYSVHQGWTSAAATRPLWQSHHLAWLLRLCVSSVLVFWPFVRLQCLPLVYHLPCQMAHTHGAGRSVLVCPRRGTTSAGALWLLGTERFNTVWTMSASAALGKGERKEQQLKDNYLLKTGHIYQACNAAREWGFPAV